MLISAHNRLCDVPRVAPITPPPTASANARTTNPNEFSFMESNPTIIYPKAMRIASGFTWRHFPGPLGGHAPTAFLNSKYMRLSSESHHAGGENWAFIYLYHFAFIICLGLTSGPSASYFACLRNLKAFISIV
jgi:hypothetical protein